MGIKTYIVEGRAYLSSTNRSPVMVLVNNRLCSLETLLKEAGLFSPVVSRTTIKMQDGLEYEISTRNTKEHIEDKVKPVRITITVEDV